MVATDIHGVSAFTDSELTEIFPVLLRFARIADSLAEAMVASESFQRDTVLQEMCSIILELSGAEVASCRAVGMDEQTDLIAYCWRSDITQFGEIPHKTHRADCKTRIKCVEGGRRTTEQQEMVESRRKEKENSELFYTEAEREHFRMLGSEAIIPLTVGKGIPKAMLVLGHRERSFFNETRITQLEALRGFFNGFFQLADLAEDRYEKQILLKRIANLIPQILNAPSKLAFYRTICALLTCERGFEFDRAMYFSMHDGQLPAMCEMAVGGIGNDWLREREALKPDFDSLQAYIDDAHEFPKPGDNPNGKPDALFLAACEGNSMTLRRGDSPELEEFLRTGRDAKGQSVLRLTHDDPWISRQHQNRNELFLNSNNEFFVFALRPLGKDGETDLMGFVIADLPYRAQRYQPGLGFPDLGMCDFFLKLVTALCYFRREAQSYFHVLTALPDLRHSGGDVLHAVEDFAESMGDRNAWSAESHKFYEKLVHHGIRISRAKFLIEQVRDSHIASSEDLYSIASDVARATENRHKDRLTIDVDSSLKSVFANIRKDDLVSILECLCDNAAIHGWADAATRTESRRSRTPFFRYLFGAGITNSVVAVRISLRKDTVRVKQRGEQTRLLLEVENDGVAIPERDAPYVFADSVTSKPESNQGTGLSSARRVARAFAGDVVLLSTAPVKFGVVLVPKEGT